MRKYFEAVSLGAMPFSGDAAKDRFYALIFGMKSKYFVLHFLLLTIALNFPVMVAIVALQPFDVYSRLMGEGFTELSADAFNANMTESGYGTTIMLPLTGMAFAVVLVLQLVFYGAVTLGAGWARMLMSKISFRNRAGIFLFSSTLPVFGALIFGLFLPTVHIIVYYLIVIIIGFKRSTVCLDVQNG